MPILHHSVPHPEAIECVAPVGDICGEGAVWHPDEQKLYWTDINRFLVHRFDPLTRTVETWSFSEPVTAVTLTSRPESLLLVFASRIGIWRPANHPSIDTLYTLPAAPQMRFNDARVDPRGLLWTGTMRNNVGPDGEDLPCNFRDGVLYSIDAAGNAIEWKHDIGISNTLAWSPDASTFYFADSIANVLYRYAYHTDTGAIEQERPFLKDFPQGVPDGSAIDAEGYLWNTRPGAGILVRISPSGVIDRTLPLPVSHPTTCTFGGSNFRTLYITTARSRQRLSGSLFALELDIGGVPDYRFHLSSH